MTLSLGFLMGFIGVAIALFIGIMIFSSTVDSIEQGIEQATIPDLLKEQATEEIDQQKNTFWIIISIIPIALFFVMFWVFGFIGGITDRLEEPKPDQDSKPGSTKQTGSLPKWIFIQFLCMIGLAKKDDKESLK